MFHKGSESNSQLHLESLCFSSSNIYFAASNEMMGQASLKQMLIV